MTSLNVVYEQALSTIKFEFPNLNDEEMLRELYNWTVLAASYFKFPRVDLEIVEYTKENPGPDGQEYGGHFVNDLSQKELTVIVEYMKYIVLFNLLSDSKKYDMYYQDANLKMPAASALAAQLNRSVGSQLAQANKIENDYYRSKNNKPTIGDIWIS